MLGKNWFDSCLPPAVRNEAKSVFQRLMTESKAPIVEHRSPVLTQTGGERLIAWKNARLTGPDGRATGMLSSGTDVTDLAQAEEAISHLARFPGENPNPVLRISRTGVIIYANDSSETLLDTWGRGVGQPLPDSHLEVAREAFRSGRFNQVEVECGERVFALVFTPVAETECINVYGLDITGLKQMQRELQRHRDSLEELVRKRNTELSESEERYRNLFEQAADAIVIVDPATGAVTEFNDLACKGLGYTREEFRALSVADYNAEWSREEILLQADMAIRVGEQTRETVQRTKNGELRNILVKSKPISIKGKKLLHCIWRDITEQKRIDRELALRTEELRRAVDLMSGRELRMAELKDTIRQLRR